MDDLTTVFSLNLGPVLLFVALVAVLGLVLAAVNAVRLRSITGPFAWVAGGKTKGDSLPALLKTIETLGRDVDRLKSELERITAESRHHIKRVGLVRYDAFEGIAGQQSYSLCLLDDKKDGVLISSLVGRDFARSYAIEITGGEASRKLGDEEASALSQAIMRGAA